MLTGIVVRTFAWMTILQDKGVINTLLIDWGLVSKPLPLMYNEFGTVVALVHIYVPFMVLTLTGVIGRIDERLEQAARSLGAGRLRAFVEVTLPLSLPGILAGSLLVFALSISAYVTPSLMGGTDVLTLPMLIAQQVGTSFNPNFAGALGVVLLLVSLADRHRLQQDPGPAVGRAGAGMNARNKQPFDAGRAAYLTLNGLLLAFLLAPIAIVLVFALNPTPYISFPPVGVSLRWFEKFFRSPEFMNALLLSLWVAGCVLVLSIVIGGACALALARGNLPGAVVPDGLLHVAADAARHPDRPGAVPVLPAGRHRPAGVGPDPGHTLVAVPYVHPHDAWRCCTISTGASRRRRPCSGASPTRVFFEVTLPLIRPGVFAGGVFAFIVSFDQFPVSLFLVVPEGRDPAGGAVQLHEIRPRRRHRRRLDGLDLARALSVVLVLERLIGLNAYVKL